MADIENMLDNKQTSMFNQKSRAGIKKNSNSIDDLFEGGDSDDDGWGDPKPAKKDVSANDDWGLSNMSESDGNWG